MVLTAIMLFSFIFKVAIADYLKDRPKYNNNLTLEQKIK